MSITGILLAAGFARRFGSQKLLAPLPDGRLVVQVAASNLLAACGRVIAVTGRDERLIRVLDDCGCQVVVNARAGEGMGTSIAAGVAASRDSDGWLIALGDMPYIAPATIRRVLAAPQAATTVVIPTFEGRRGHPVRFPAMLAEDLLALQGDRGAREVIDRHAANFLLLETGDRGVLADIDTPADLQ